jgi:dihydrofolate synthase / folylpolyglutamate synthase
LNPERWLSSLDPIGWRFGLERIEALLEELGQPQRAFDSIHVVGTNGKSSVTVMTAAIVEARGRTTGCYLSPHAERWAPRVRVGGREIDGAAFATAVERVAAALPAAEARLAEKEPVTQFEAATAVAFVALAEAGVEVGVIEAGLGGRLDATNVLPSRATVLTSVGLDHTAWLGETELEIAAEKLAVLRESSILVLGDVSEDVAELAERTAAERGCRIVRPRHASFAVELAAPYLRRNLDVAIAAAEVVVEAADAETVGRALQSADLGGRFERIDGKPPLVLDAAHNVDGARALAEALAESDPGVPVVACLAILADKDAPGIIASLAPLLSAAVCTEIPPERLEGAGRPGTTAVPAAELVRLCEESSISATAQREPGRAVALAAAMARERKGLALIAGSHYLLGYAWTERPGQSSSR